jgi:outer membrane immunogenic protein
MTRISLFLAAGVSAIALASAAQAADLIIEEPSVPVVETYDGSWDGFYLGVFTGYAVGEATDEDAASPTDLDGAWIGGFNLGADFTLTDGIVVGVVGDIAYLGLEGISTDDIAYDLFWGGSLRGKLGFDGGAFLPYLTAGLAFGSAEVEGSGAVTGVDSNTHIGWTAGAGVEFAVTEDVSLDLLYKYTDYGTQDYTLSDGDHEVGFTTHSVTAGLNWRF